mmetsp:Transcript_154814/g.288621  ORF Transcript_154814/g.288621 Transcript_154814/m.288621 type:complete len:344 (+) Transcript_154814:67-1098(+)
MASADFGMSGGSHCSSGSSSGSLSSAGQGRLAAAGARCASPRERPRSTSAAAPGRSRGAAGTSRGAQSRPTTGRRPPLPPTQRSSTATTAATQQQHARTSTPQPMPRSGRTSRTNSLKSRQGDEEMWKERSTHCDSLGSTLASETDGKAVSRRSRSADCAGTQQGCIEVWEHDFRQFGGNVQKLLQCQAPPQTVVQCSRSPSREGVPMSEFELKCRKPTQPTDPWKHMDPNPEGSRPLSSCDFLLNQFCPPAKSECADEEEQPRCSRVSLAGRHSLFQLSNQADAICKKQSRISSHDEFKAEHRASVEKHQGTTMGVAKMDRVVDRIYSRHIAGQLAGLIPVC